MQWVCVFLFIIISVCLNWLLFFVLMWKQVCKGMFILMFLGMQMKELFDYIVELMVVNLLFFGGMMVVKCLWKRLGYWCMLFLMDRNIMFSFFYFFLRLWYIIFDLYCVFILVSVVCLVFGMFKCLKVFFMFLGMLFYEWVLKFLGLMQQQILLRFRLLRFVFYLGIGLFRKMLSVLRWKLSIYCGLFLVLEIILMILCDRFLGVLMVYFLGLFQLYLYFLLIWFVLGLMVI